MTGFKKFQLPPPIQPEDLPEYLAGYMLISETELKDPNFFRTVVLLLNHDENGSMGLITNRPSNATLSDLSEDLTETSFSSYPVYIGGPVEQNYLFALHTGFPGNVKSDGAIEAAENIVFEPDFEVLRSNFNRLLETPETQVPSIRFFAGYAGWASGQLETELQRGDWVVIRAVSDLVFSDEPGKSWKQALYKKGGLYWVAAETGYKPSIN